MTIATMIQALQGQVGILESHGNHDAPVNAITDDSRTVRAGSLFVAVKGEQVDGHQFITAAMKAGMAALVTQQPAADLSIPLVRVTDYRKALGLLGSRNFA